MLLLLLICECYSYCCCCYYYYCGCAFKLSRAFESLILCLLFSQIKWSSFPVIKSWLQLSSRSSFIVRSFAGDRQTSMQRDSTWLLFVAAAAVVVVVVVVVVVTSESLRASFLLSASALRNRCFLPFVLLLSDVRRHSEHESWSWSRPCAVTIGPEVLSSFDLEWKAFLLIPGVCRHLKVWKLVRIARYGGNVQLEFLECLTISRPCVYFVLGVVEKSYFEVICDGKMSRSLTVMAVFLLLVPLKFLPSKDLLAGHYFSISTSLDVRSHLAD